MLDPDEVADYEAWKMSKLTGQLDTSIGAYNLEMESQALAYDKAVKDIIPASDWEKQKSFLDGNPYRRAGRRGGVSETRRVSAPVVPLSVTPNDESNSFWEDEE